MLHTTQELEPPAKPERFNKAISAFLELKPFWFVMHRAVHDLRTKMKLLNIDLQAAAALLLQEDLRNPQETAVRVSAMLSEDLADHPQLRDWS